MSAGIAIVLLAGCSFDTVSIGITDPNEDDGFGGYVPAHERARWEVPVWERPPNPEETEEFSDSHTPPAEEDR